MGVTVFTVKELRHERAGGGQAPGVLHRVIIRGIERRNIFEDDKDRDNLLNRLGDLFPATKTSCYAWACFY